MTDDVIVSGGTVTFRQNLWKRVFQLAACVFCAALGAGVLAIAMGNEDLAMQGLGVVLILFSLYAGYKIATNPRTTLIVSAEGIMPMYLVPEKRTLIRWSNIERMEKVVQKMRGNRTSYLALYLREPLELQDEKAVLLRRMVAGSMSDGAVADAYIPELMLPEKVEKVIERLERIRAGGPNA